MHTKLSAIRETGLKQSAETHTKMFLPLHVCLGGTFDQNFTAHQIHQATSHHIEHERWRVQRCSSSNRKTQSRCRQRTQSLAKELTANGPCFLVLQNGENRTSETMWKDFVSQWTPWVINTISIPSFQQENAGKRIEEQISQDIFSSPPSSRVWQFAIS